MSLMMRLPLQNILCFKNFLPVSIKLFEIHINTFVEVVTIIGMDSIRPQHRLNCLAPMNYRSLLYAA